MEIPKGISDLLNWNTIIGKVAWAVLGLVWKWLWKTCKSWEAGLKRQVAQIITMILGGVLLLTLIGQISVSISGYMGMQNYPSFKMVIFNPGLSDSNPRTHTLSVDAKIWNDGAPSVVVGWSLSIKGPDKRSYTFPQLVVLPGETNTLTALANDGSSRVYKWADSMQAKAGEIPIAHGGLVSGYVLFQISDSARDYLLSPNTTYEILCEDTHGKAYSLKFNWPAPNK